MTATVEVAFPERIRAIYLVGSYAKSTAVPHSDLDLIIIFKGTCKDDAAERLRQLRQHASKFAPVRIDLTPKCEADLLSKRATRIKLGGKFLSGEDIHEQIPFEPIEQYQQHALRGFLTYQREIRGGVEPPSPQLPQTQTVSFWAMKSTAFGMRAISLNPARAYLSI